MAEETFVVVEVSPKRWRIAIVKDKKGIPVAVFISGKHKTFESALRAYLNWNSPSMLLKELRTKKLENYEKI